MSKLEIALEERGLLEKFKKETLNGYLRNRRSGELTDELHEEALGFLYRSMDKFKDNPAGAIHCCFAWDQSEDGHSFWKDLTEELS